MHKTLAWLPALLLTSGSVSALDQVFFEPIVPVSTSQKSIGGISTANADGWDGLWANPASLATPQVHLTLSSVETSLQLPLGAAQTLVDSRSDWGNVGHDGLDSPLIGLANNLLTQTGLGAEVNYGLGWEGSNLGLALDVGARAQARGTTLTASNAEIQGNVQGMVGFAWPFDVGLGNLKLGVGVRPFYQDYALVSAASALDHMGNLSAYNVLSGFGLAWDLGARWEWQGLRAGLVLRDIGGTTLDLRNNPASTWLTGLTFPSGGDQPDILYRIPMVVGLGTSWTPDLGSLGNLVRPSVGLDFQVPVKDQYTQSSFWTWTHVGGQVTVLNFLSVRAGLNQGWPTFGLGFQVPGVAFDLGIYSDEMGRYSGTERRPGISTQLTLGW